MKYVSALHNDEGKRKFETGLFRTAFEDGTCSFILDEIELIYYQRKHL